MKNVTIYTDGACSNNPGKGGWASILIYNGREKEMSGAEDDTTNNRMELKAIIEGLKQLNQPCIVNIYSDSAYCVNAISKGWLNGWLKNGWKNAENQEIKNRDLWLDYLEQSKKHTITLNKVKGHADDEINNRCDKLARLQILKKE